MPSTPKWKLFEQDISDYLKIREAQEPLTFHRFYDTRSAGDFLPSQPADFLILSRGRTIILEAKHSVIHQSLRSCFSGHVKDIQIGHHRVWQRALATTFFLFKSEPKDAPVNIELWDGKALVKARREGKRLRREWLVREGPTLEKTLTNLYLHLPGERVALL